MSLDELATHYGTDKSSEYHGYTKHYEREIDRSSIGSLLELGWLDGASMKMWRDWLPDWQITGLDIEGKEPISGVTFIHSGQDDPLMPLAVSPYSPFDVVVDDASHESHRTITSFRLLWPLVKPGGCYFIEDLRTSYYRHWNQNSGSTIMQYLKDQADCVHDPSSDIESVFFWPGLAMIRKILT